jgi:two-component sensor histidine kinase
MTLDVMYALPCGLIINELLTNSLKYAFPRDFGGPCRITIGLSRDHNTCILTVADTGRGMPPDFDWRKSKSLGMRLVNLWATHQLGGTLKVDGEQGTTCVITFTIAKEKE